MKKTNILLGGFACLALLGAGCAPATQDTSSDTDTTPVVEETGPIKLGWFGPLTGDAVIYGEPVKNGLEMAVKEINDAGGINGRMLEVTYEDGKCNGKDASAAVQKLVNVDEVDYILGGVCSGEVLAAAPITEESKTIILSPTATSPDVSDAGDFIFRNVPADDASGAALAKVAYEDGFRKIAIISEQTDFAEGIHRVFSESFKEMGGEITLEERFSPGTKDFRSIVTKVAASEADAVVVNPQTVAAGGPLVKQLREQEVTLPVYSNAVIADESFFDIAGKEAAEGTIFTDVPGLDENSEKANTFLANYKEMFSAETVPFPFYAGSSYDGAYILKQAIENAGDNSEAVRDYFYNLKDYSGIIGTYGFDENGDLVGIEYIVREAKDGQFVTK